GVPDQVRCTRTGSKFPCPGAPLVKVVPGSVAKQRGRAHHNFLTHQRGYGARSLASKRPRLGNTGALPTVIVTGVLLIPWLLASHSLYIGSPSPFLVAPLRTRCGFLVRTGPRARSVFVG